MDAARAGQALANHTARLRETVAAIDSAPLMGAARQIAQQVRLAASHAGDSVAIRVVHRRGGVRITVTGPRASKYRALMKDSMDRQMPQVQADVRAQITRRAR